MPELLSPLFVFIHHLDEPFVFAFIILSATLGVGLFKRSYALGLFVSVALSFGLTHILKNIFAVPRPESMLLLTDGYRFPSLHAAVTSAIVTSLVLCALRIFSPLWIRVCAVVCGLAILLVVDISRVALSVHEPIDVIVGSAIGIGISLLVHRYLERHSS